MREYWGWVWFGFFLHPFRREDVGVGRKERGGWGNREGLASPFEAFGAILGLPIGNRTRRKFPSSKLLFNLFSP